MITDYIKISIRAKFISFTLLPIVVFLAVVLVVSIYALENYSVKEIELEQTQLTQYVSRELNRALLQAEQLAWHNQQFLQLTPHPEQQQWFALVRNTVAASPIIYGAAVAIEPSMNTGNKLFSPYAFQSDQGPQVIDIGEIDQQSGYDYSDGTWAWWSVPKQSQQAYWSTPYFDQGAGNKIMTTYSLPFFFDGRFAGVTSVDIVLEQLFQALNLTEQPMDMIITRSGKFIKHPDKTAVLKDFFYDLNEPFVDVDLKQVLASITSGNTSLLKLPRQHQDGDLWLFYTPIPATDWFYLHTLSEYDALSITYYQLGVLGCLFFIIILLVFLVIWIISGMLTKPVKDLQIAAERVSQGDYQLDISYRSQDELGRLSHEFGNMVASLASREQDLNRRVAQRTRELQNTQLKMTEQNAMLERQIVELAEARRAALNMMQDAEQARLAVADQLKFEQGLIDTIPNALFYTDHLGRFLGCNQAYEALFAVSSKDLSGISLLHHPRFRPDEQQQYYQEVTEVIAKQSQVKREVELSLPRQRVRHMLYSASAFLKTDGSAAGMVGTFVDISAQKDISRQLDVAKNAAEAATEAKANFLASMSHEIRTPMNGIIGMVELLRQSNLDGQHKLMLQTISDSGQALLTIINDILDLSKIEAGKMQLELLPISMLDVVEGAAETLSHNALAKGLRLLSFVDPYIPHYVIGDPVRLRQILIKFTQQGEVSVTARLSRTAESQQDILRLSVKDSGIGISRQAQTKLFQAFSQAESSTTRHYGGTGLGLSICQRLISIMGGKIGVNSQPGQGSEFFVTLPLNPSNKPVIVRSTSNLRGVNVLMVSNSKVEINAALEYLGYWEAQVRITERLENAVAKASEMVGTQGCQVLIIGSCWSAAQRQQLEQSVLATTSLAMIKLVIMSSGRRHKPRLEQPRTVRLDVTPFKRVNFLSAVAIAVGRESPEIAEEELVEDLKANYLPSYEQALASGQLVLVAEDNPTNQDVIKRQLTMLGYVCDVCDDGQLALQAWQKKPYGILLTDCHMPNMDGYQLTAAIRALPVAEGANKPIVAITANALQGEAQRCLDAGMNDYLPKPLDMKKLKITLQKWLPVTEVAASQTSGSTAQDKLAAAPGSSTLLPDAAHPATTPMLAPAPVDDRVLKNMFGDDQQMFTEILQDFVAPTEQIVAQLLLATEQGDANAIWQHSHKLKSSARSIGAHALGDLCQQLELLGKAQQLADCENLARQVEQQVAAVLRYIQTLSSGPLT